MQGGGSGGGLWGLLPGQAQLRLCPPGSAPGHPVPSMPSGRPAPGGFCTTLATVLGRRHWQPRCPCPDFRSGSHSSIRRTRRDLWRWWSLNRKTRSLFHFISRFPDQPCLLFLPESAFGHVFPGTCAPLPSSSYNPLVLVASAALRAPPRSPRPLSSRLPHSPGREEGSSRLGLLSGSRVAARVISSLLSPLASFFHCPNPGVSKQQRLRGRNRSGRDRHRLRPSESILLTIRPLPGSLLGLLTFHFPFF